MRFWIGLVALLFLYACTEPGKSARGIANDYFDLASFFQEEARQLTDDGKTVLKTVSKNGIQERKRVKINWERELELFRESDINKPAWRNSYKTIINKDTTAYQAIDSGLKTRNISIVKNNNGKIKHIQITNHISNFLFTSSEKLNYYPDSMYRIEKIQSVKLMGKNDYVITGSLK